MMAAEIRKRTISGSPDELDAAGFFPVPGETDEQFASRLETLSGELEALRDGSSDLLPLLRQSRPLSREVRDAANQLTWETYRFRADWVAGWYSSRRTGLFSAGILLEVDGALPLLFLHGTFARRNRRWGYDAAETLAHELIHAVRIAFPASVYEEYFPCQVHASAFRRWAGNLFRRWYLPFFSLGGIAAAAVLAAVGNALWFLPLAGPLLVLAREFQIRRRLGKAAHTLRMAGVDPLPVLLRLSDQEIFEIAALSPAELEERRKYSPRWRRLLERFPFREES
ncbi:hypothetical protein [uncultured Victivallis sp.]|uniref:hypothetical protein n=1 Tax=uncultured Victivallis sp. TaxID=354118 RepID=UPI0025FA361A|nr:hypothetical protein [uncultured Victivallis sp.]